MTICWRCKREFEPEQSPFWPNMRETCAVCVLRILPAVWPYGYGNIPERLLVDVMKSSEVEQAEKIIGGRV